MTQSLCTSRIIQIIIKKLFFNFRRYIEKFALFKNKVCTINFISVEALFKSLLAPGVVTRMCLRDPYNFLAITRAWV